jgi:hypothetical protein
MWRCLLSLVLLLALGSAPALAQGIPPPTTSPSAGPPPENTADRPPPPLPWAVAFLITAGILVIVCMPSRKS